MKRVIFILIQALWGFPQTIVGVVVLLAHIRHPHYRFHGAIVTPWNKKGSLSVGPFIFLSRHLKPEFVEHILVHEYGHCIQSLIFGPLYLLVMGLPSLIWGELPALRKLRREEHVPYFGFYTERLANYLGTKVTGLPAMQGY